MNNRIKEIRKDDGSSQEKFGKVIGVSRDTIANIEAGRIEIKDIFITSICREFSVNEEWLRTGQGEKYKELTRNKQIFNFANSVMEDLDESFRKRMILALSKLSKDDWEVLERIADNLTKK